MVGNNKTLVNVSIVFIAVSLFIFLLKTFASFLRPLVVAILLTVLFKPLMAYSKKNKIPPYLSISIVVIVLLLFLGLFGGIILTETETIKNSLPLYQNKLNAVVTWLDQEFSFNLRDVVTFKNLTSFIAPLLQAASSIISEIFIIVVFLIFLVPFYYSFIKKLNKYLTKKNKNKLNNAINKVELSIRKYLTTKTLVSFLTALLTSLILFMFGADFILITSLMIFIFNFIPNIGSIIGVVIISFLYFFKMGLSPYLIPLIVLLTTIQIFFGNVLEPKLTGKKLEISPLIIILSLFIWYWIWGIMGMFLSVPLTSIIKIILENFNSTKKYADFMS